MIARLDDKRLRWMERSKALMSDNTNADYSCIKWAETDEEWAQAFALVHREYLKLGYIRRPHPFGMHFSAHNLLPDASTLVIKSESTVVATMSLVKDTHKHGLPMDTIYSAELNGLRRKGRKIAELCSMVTSRHCRWKSLYMRLSRIMYAYARSNGIDEFCIMVNPKHVPFYKLIFLFEIFGKEKFYPALGVPAVAMRANLNKMKALLKDKYAALETHCNLYAFMHVNYSFSNASQRAKAASSACST